MGIAWQAGLLAAALALVSACAGSGEVRGYRMTVEVDTPAGLRSGSSVIGFSTASVPRWLPGSPGSATSMEGESPVVDLGEGRLLIALLHDEHRGHAVRDWQRPELRHSDNSIRADRLPVLVTFRDWSDPASIVDVPPTDLAAHFGSGYRLRSVRFEPTDEHPTFGRLAALPLFADRILRSPSARLAPATSRYKQEVDRTALDASAFIQRRRG